MAMNVHHLHLILTPIHMLSHSPKNKSQTKMLEQKWRIKFDDHNLVDVILKLMSN